MSQKTLPNGRSGSKWDAATKKKYAVEGDFAPTPTDLLDSVAWQSMKVNTRKLIDFLLREHRWHSSTENGALIATYNQLEEYGLSRRLIKSAIDDAVELGLIRIERVGTKAHPSLYRLTFLKDRGGAPATNEWKKVSARMVDEKNSLRCSRRCTEQVHEGEPHSGEPQSAQTMKTAEFREISSDKYSSPSCTPIYTFPESGMLSKSTALRSDSNQQHGIGNTADPKTRQIVPNSVPPIHLDQHPDRSFETTGQARNYSRRQKSGSSNDLTSLQLDLWIDPHPATEEPLRDLATDYDEWLKHEKPNALIKTANRLSLSRSDMSNFRAGRFDLNPTAAKVLRQIINGEVAL